MPAVALGILSSRCGDGGPRIERSEHGASCALVPSPTSVKEKSINTIALPIALTLHSHDGLLPVDVALCNLSSRRDSREGENDLVGLSACGSRAARSCSP